MATELVLMNPLTGDVLPESYWIGDGFTDLENDLVVVEWSEKLQIWVEV